MVLYIIYSYDARKLKHKILANVSPIYVNGGLLQNFLISSEAASDEM